ncbi:MAG: betaine-aldehyde dehydrogenase [Verrucomicrobiales bacterium]|jgi:betaine-aldehyde dehydrogenase
MNQTGTPEGPASEDLVASVLQHAGTPTRLFAGNEWIDATGGSVASINPATEEEICSIGVASAADVDKVVELATEGAAVWRDMPWNERAVKMNLVADAIAENGERLAMIDTIESGLPITGMRGDAKGAAKELRFFAGISGEAKGETFPDSKSLFASTVLEPYGVVGRIVPFNHPLKYAAGKSAAILAAGNSVVLKPAEQTSLTTLEFARLASEILPPGVVNVVTGSGPVTGMAVVEHPGIPRLAFTGGVESGRVVNEAAARHFKSVSLELGGKNPLVVFADANVDKAAAAAVAGMNFKRSMGQSCMSQSRIFVHESVHDEFVVAFSKLVQGLTVGDPTASDTDIGPLVFAAHRDRVLGHIDTARSQGAKVVVGGGKGHSDRGYYVEPTVMTNVTTDMNIAQDEVFGPVAAIIEWNDYEVMVEALNGLSVGLTANLWTNDQANAFETARRVHAGLVWINGSGAKPLGVPFGGYKDSGLGREGSLDEMLSYTRKKSIVMHYQHG